MYGWEPTFESLGKPIPKQVSSGWHLKQIEEWLLLSSMCAVVCSYCMPHQHLDAKIVKHFPIEMYGWEPTFESPSKHTKAGILGVALKEIEEWLLLSSMCAVVCWHIKKIVNISHRDVCMGTYF